MKFEWVGWALNENSDIYSPPSMVWRSVDGSYPTVIEMDPRVFWPDSMHHLLTRRYTLSPQACSMIGGAQTWLRGMQ